MEPKQNITPEQIIALRDIQAWIEFGIENDLSIYKILGTVNHDVVGLINEDKCFLPRSSGYSKIKTS